MTLAGAAARELLDRLDPESYVLVLGGGADVLARAGHRVATDPAAGPFDAALAPDGVLAGALGDELACLRRVLAPGGLLLFDLPTPTGDGPAIAEDHERLVLTREDADTRTVTTFRRVDAATWRRTDRAEPLHAPADVLDRLRGHGFAAHTLPAYAGESLPAGRTVFVAD